MSVSMAFTIHAMYFILPYKDFILNVKIQLEIASVIRIRFYTIFG